MTGHYSDPTANSAISRADRQIREMSSIRILAENGKPLTAAQRSRLQALKKHPSAAVQAAMDMAYEAHLKRRRKNGQSG